MPRRTIIRLSLASLLVLFLAIAAQWLLAVSYEVVFISDGGRRMGSGIAVFHVLSRESLRPGCKFIGDCDINLELQSPDTQFEKSFCDMIRMRKKEAFSTVKLTVCDGKYGVTPSKCAMVLDLFPGWHDADMHVLFPSDVLINQKGVVSIGSLTREGVAGQVLISERAAVADSLCSP